MVKYCTFCKKDTEQKRDKVSKKEWVTYLCGCGAKITTAYFEEKEVKPEE